jgi:lipoate-protein ligase A
VCRPTRPAIVLGSTQSSDVVDRAAAASAGLEVVRRRSGGGAVLVTPDDPVWIDVWVPAGDALWKADVTGAFGWLGSTWARALEGLGLTGVGVQGPAPGACTRWSSLLCFAGVGAGEVSVGGRKVVGLAQRRNRSGAWFHGACLLRWDPTLLLATLDLPPAEREVATAGLAPAVAGVADALGSASGPSRDAVTTALLGSLPGSPGVG